MRRAAGTGGGDHRSWSTERIGIGEYGLAKAGAGAGAGKTATAWAHFVEKSLDSITGAVEHALSDSCDV